MCPPDQSLDPRDSAGIPGCTHESLRLWLLMGPVTPMWLLVGTPACTVNWIREGDSRVRNSVLGLWSLRSGDCVAKPGRLVVFLSCGGEGCECQSQPTGAPRDSGTSSPRRGHPFGTADTRHLRSHLGIPGMSPMLRSLEPSPAGSQCLPKAGSRSASALHGHLAGWVPAPLGQFLPQLISSLWPMPGNEPSLAEQAACVVSARQACFCCWHWPHFPRTLPGGRGTIPHRVLLGACRRPLVGVRHPVVSLDLPPYALLVFAGCFAVSKALSHCISSDAQKPLKEGVVPMRWGVQEWAEFLKD